MKQTTPSQQCLAKYSALLDYLKEKKSILVAFSGGVDSTFLARAVYEALGENSLAVTARSETYAEREFRESLDLAKLIGIRQKVIHTSELEDENMASNPPARCYYCKHELFSKLLKVATDEGLAFVADGANYDDLGDFRPGMKASEELSVISPLKDLEFTKKDIRDLSKMLDLPTWDKPAMACLSSRFPYGTRITAERVNQVAEAELFLWNLGIREMRVRYHDAIARIELNRDEMKHIIEQDVSDKIITRFKELGFTYVTLDIQGFRSGSMNEVL
jgi:uncharacterized protein